MFDATEYRIPASLDEGEDVGIRLNIGGSERADGWDVLNIIPGPHVDYVGDCRDLSRFADNSVDQIYASHVLEHVGFSDGERALKEWHRVLAPGGALMVSVPDIETLSTLFLKDGLTFVQKFELMKMMFGGQEDAHAFHCVGYFPYLLALYMTRAGFENVQQVPGFGLFKDFSEHRAFGIPISLNMQARKPA